MMLQTKIRAFNGIANDPRNKNGGAQMLTNFDIFTYSNRIVPYRDSESGDNAASTSQKQNFCIALRSGTTYKLFGLGVVTGTARAEVLMKDITTGGSSDLGDAAWSTPSNNQSSAGSTAFDLFLYYRKVGLILGARAGTHIWAFDPSSSAAWQDTYRAISYTNIAQGLVHSKDDIAYIPYDNKIAKCDNGSWTDAALTLPSHLKITSIFEEGNYLGIACAPVSGVGRSVVYLWDRDSSLATLSESIDWYDENLQVADKVEGVMVGVSYTSTGRNSYRVIVRAYTGGVPQKIEEFTSTSVPVLRIAKQVYDNRLYFMMQVTLAGVIREGVWSVGRKNGRFVVAHERTPNNDTAIGNGALKNFYIVGDYMFISYVNNSNANALSKTSDTSAFTATAIVETAKYDQDLPGKKKQLASVTVFHPPLPSGGSITLSYRKDEASAWTEIFENTTADSLSHTAVNIESTGDHFDEYEEIQFRAESTGGAEIIGIDCESEFIGKTPDA